MILVQRRIDVRHLALAEIVIELRVDRLRGQAQFRRRLAVDIDVGFKTVDLLVGRDVGEGIGALLHFTHQGVRPGLQARRVVAFQRILILQVRLAAADAEILGDLEEHLGAGDVSQLGTQAVQHVVRR